MCETRAERADPPPPAAWLGLQADRKGAAAQSESGTAVLQDPWPCRRGRIRKAEPAHIVAEGTLAIAVENVFLFDLAEPV